MTVENNIDIEDIEDGTLEDILDGVDQITDEELEDLIAGADDDEDDGIDLDAEDDDEDLNEAAKVAKDLDDNKPILVSGVMGMKSKPFKKKFKNLAAFNKWTDSEEYGNYEVETVVNEEANPEYKYDLKGDIDALIETNKESLNEEFVKSAANIFEAAVSSRVNAEIAALEDKYATEYEEKLEEEITEISKAVDTYLSAVAETFVKENRLAIEEGIRTEIAENFMKSLRRVFVENYIEVPEAKVDIVEKLSKLVLDLQTEVATLEEKNEKAEAYVSEATKTTVLESISSGLSLMEKTKLNDMAKSIVFVDEAQYRKDAKRLKESLVKTTSEDLDDRGILISEKNEENFDETNDILVNAAARMLSSQKL